MPEKVKIKISRSGDQFAVGTGMKPTIVATYEDAKATALTMQKRMGGPEKAEIIDLAVRR